MSQLTQGVVVALTKRKTSTEAGSGKPKPPPKPQPKPYTGESTLVIDATRALGLSVSIGGICIEWSLLEMFLSLIYARLVFGHRDKRDPAENTIIEAFETLPTWQTKCNLLRGAAASRFDKEVAEELGDLLTSFEPIQRRRNNVVHARWELTPETPPQFVRKRTIFGPAELWTPECFIQLRADIREAIIKLSDFLDKIRERFKQQADYVAMLSTIIGMQSVPTGDGKETV